MVHVNCISGTVSQSGGVCEFKLASVRTGLQASAPPHHKHPNQSRPHPVCSQNNIGDPKNFIFFIGYIARVTLGVQILRISCRIKIFCESQDECKRVASIDACSGHADKPELHRQVESLRGESKKVSVIHGTESQCLAFAETRCALRPLAEIVVPERKGIVSI